MPGAAVAAGLVDAGSLTLRAGLRGLGGGHGPNGRCTRGKQLVVVSADVGWGRGDAGPEWTRRGHSGMTGPS